METLQNDEMSDGQPTEFGPKFQIFAMVPKFLNCISKNEYASDDDIHPLDSRLFADASVVGVDVRTSENAE